MTNLPKDAIEAFTRTDAAHQELSLKLTELDDRRLDLVRRFVEELLICHDPDIVETFLAWRSDPNLGSILELAAAVSGEMREQLLFMAEDLYSRQHAPQ